MYTVFPTSTGFDVISPIGTTVETYGFRNHIEGSYLRAKTFAADHARRMNKVWNRIVAALTSDPR